MSANERDTHFQEASVVLLRNLEHLARVQSADGIHVTASDAIKLIAHYSYDLVAHVIEHTGLQQYDPATGRESATIDEVIVRIPDMTAWPKSE